MELILDNNLLSTQSWIDGGTGDAILENSYWREYGNSYSLNERTTVTNPFGFVDVAWHSKTSGKSGGTIYGGFNALDGNFQYIPVDKTKTYRFSIWVKRKNITDNVGRLFFGLWSVSGTTRNNIMSLDGVSTNNPYFESCNTSQTHNIFPEDEWRLCVSHLRVNGTLTGSTKLDESGIYMTNGTKLTTGFTFNEYIIGDDTYTTGIRVLCPYNSSNINEEAYFIYPRIDIVDGTEPSVAELLSGLTYKLNSGGTYYDVGSVKLKYNDSWYDVENIKLKKDNNLLDYSDWSTDFSGSTNDFVEYCTSVGGINTRILDTDPFNNNMYLWQGSGTSSGTTAGWQTTSIPIDHTKKYRFSVWMKRIGGTIGRYYFGFFTRDSSDSAINSKRVNDGLLHANFYFFGTVNLNFTTITTNHFPENEWRLLVGYVLDSSYSEGYIDKWSPKIYDIYGNVKVNSAVNYMFLTGTTYVKHRIYAPFEGDSVYKMAYPRIDVVDGTEPSITTLLTSEGVWLDAKTFNKNEEF